MIWLKRHWFPVFPALDILLVLLSQCPRPGQISQTGWSIAEAGSVPPGLLHRFAFSILHIFSHIFVDFGWIYCGFVVAVSARRHSSVEFVFNGDHDDFLDHFFWTLALRLALASEFDFFDWWRSGRFVTALRRPDLKSKKIWYVVLLKDIQ